MTKTILVADDSKTIQNVVSLTFRATDFKVVSVSDGEEALRRIPELRPDIVLADVAMPGRNGYELCREVKASAATSNIPVLLLAGAFEPFDDRRAAEARADGHIKKPFDSQSLIDRVTALTGARAPEMPMSFAASLAARQKTDAAPSFAAGGSLPRSQPLAAAPLGGSAGGAVPPRSASSPAVQPRSVSSPAVNQASARSIASDLGVPGASSPASAPMSWGASVPQTPPMQQPPMQQHASPQSLHSQAFPQSSQQHGSPQPAHQLPSLHQQPSAQSSQQQASPQSLHPQAPAQSSQQHASSQSLQQPPHQLPSLHQPPSFHPQTSPQPPPQPLHQARPVSGPSLMIEEPEYLEDAEIVEDDDDDDAAARSVPSLEPPRPPSAAQAAERAKVDVWALAEGSEDQIPRPRALTRDEPRANDVPAQVHGESSDIEAIEEIDIDEIPPDRRRDTPVAEAIERTANAAAPALAAAAAIAVPGLPHDELLRVAREIIERIAWEVVPELAETIIRAELDRLTRE
jgi:CheY-like chemotaxis protein